MAAIALLLAVSSPAAITQYNYTLHFTLVNGQTAMLPDSASSPFFSLLNQNVFRNTSFQTSTINSVTLDGVPAEWSIQFDRDGNPLLTVQHAAPLSPLANSTLEISFSIDLSKPEFSLETIGSISDIPADVLDHYPMTGVWNISEAGYGQEIVDTAFAIKGAEENVLAIVLKMLQWFEENVSYSADLSVPQSISDTFRLKSGDCDDQANLFAAFCRILGIPAYSEIGPIYMPGFDYQVEGNLRFNLTNVGYHGWAVVYLPSQDGGQWVPVDLTFFKNAYFVNGHIRSISLYDHINNSAIMYYDALVMMQIVTSDYVDETIALKGMVMGSDCVWIESHSMILIANGNPAYSPSVYYIMPFVALLSLIALTVMIQRDFRRRR